MIDLEKFMLDKKFLTHNRGIYFITTYYSLSIIVSTLSVSNIEDKSSSNICHYQLKNKCHQQVKLKSIQYYHLVAHYFLLKFILNI